MKIKYLGPRSQIRTSVGLHHKGEVKDYAEPIGQELLKTSKKQKFEEVAGEKNEANERSESQKNKKQKD